jgi:hypothetical protein
MVTTLIIQMRLVTGGRIHHRWQAQTCFLEKVAQVRNPPIIALGGAEGPPKKMRSKTTGRRGARSDPERSYLHVKNKKIKGNLHALIGSVILERIAYSIGGLVL